MPNLRIVLLFLGLSRVGTAVTPGGTLHLSFEFFTDGTLESGTDCDFFDTCDVYFRICVATESNGECDIFNKSTDPIQNVAGVAYENKYAFPIFFLPSINELHVTIEAWDHDVPTNDDFIGRVEGLVFISNVSSAVETPLNLHPPSVYKNEFSISATMKKVCNKGYSGPRCDVSENKTIEGSTKVQTAASYSSAGPRNHQEANPRCTRSRVLIGGEVCLNGGVCQDSLDGSSYSCHCPPGYSGVRCEVHDSCFNITCSRHGLCQQIGARKENFVCDCEPGWRGVLCDIPFPSACLKAFESLPAKELSICLHGGVCIDLSNGTGFSCQCVNGWMGERCEKHFIQYASVNFESFPLQFRRRDFPTTPLFIVPILVVTALLIFTWIAISVFRKFHLKLVRRPTQMPVVPDLPPRRICGQEYVASIAENVSIYSLDDHSEPLVKK